MQRDVILVGRQTTPYIDISIMPHGAALLQYSVIRLGTYTSRQKVVLRLVPMREREKDREKSYGGEK